MPSRPRIAPTRRCSAWCSARRRWCRSSACSSCLALHVLRPAAAGAAHEAPAAPAPGADRRTLKAGLALSRLGFELYPRYSVQADNLHYTVRMREGRARARPASLAAILARTGQDRTRRQLHPGRTASVVRRMAGRRARGSAGTRHPARSRRPGARPTSTNRWPVVIERDRAQAETVLPLETYIARRLTPSRHEHGREMFATHKELLDEIVGALRCPARDHRRHLGHGIELRPVQRRAADGRRAGDAGVGSAAVDALPPRALRRARDPEPRRHRLRRMRGLLGRRDGTAAVHAVELPAVRRGLRRRRPARHLGIAGRRLRVDRQLPEGPRLERQASLGPRGQGLARSWPRASPRTSRGATGTCQATRDMTGPLPLDRVAASWACARWTAQPLPKADFQASLVSGTTRHFLVYANYDALLAYNCAHAYALGVALLSPIDRAGRAANDLGRCLVVLALIGRGRLRHHAAHPRDSPQLPDRRPLPLLARGGRPGAAPVHRHRQRRGAAVLARSAALGLRVVEEGEQLLRLRHRQRSRAVVGVPHRQAVAFPLSTRRMPASRGYDPQYRIPCAKVLGGTAGRKKAFRPASIVNTSAMSYGSLSAAAVEAINRGVELAGCMQNTGEGGISPSPHRAAISSGRSAPATSAAATTAGGFDLDRVCSRRSRLARSARSRSSSARARSRASAACCPAAKITPEIARDPRHPDRTGLHQPGRAHRVPRRRRACSTSSSSSPTRPAFPSASSPPSATSASGATSARLMATTGPRPRLHHDRRRRRRHRRGAARVHRSRRAAVQARLHAGLPRAGAAGRARAGRVHRLGQARLSRRRAARDRARLRHGQRRARGDARRSAASRRSAATPATARPASRRRTSG